MCARFLSLRFEYSVSTLAQEKEWEEYGKELGDVFKIFVAFSREPGQKKTYVQELIRREGDLIKKSLVEKKGYCYICGDAKHMVRLSTHPFLASACLRSYRLTRSKSCSRTSLVRQRAAVAHRARQSVRMLFSPVSFGIDHLHRQDDEGPQSLALRRAPSLARSMAGG